MGCAIFRYIRSTFQVCYVVTIQAFHPLVRDPNVFSAVTAIRKDVKWDNFESMFSRTEMPILPPLHRRALRNFLLLLLLLPPFHLVLYRQQARWPSASSCFHFCVSSFCWVNFGFTKKTWRCLPCCRDKNKGQYKTHKG